MVFPYVTGKNFAFRILTEITAFFWIGLITINKKYRPHNSSLFLSVLLFSFIVGLADLLGVSPYNSFWSNYERMEGYITILHLVLYFMILRTVLRTRGDWILFFNALLVASFFVSLYSLLAPAAAGKTAFWMEYGDRIYGPAGNPPFLAAYLLLCIFIAFLSLANVKNTFLKAFYVSLVLIHSIVIYLTATRGAIVAGIVGLTLLVMFAVFDRRRSFYSRKIRTAILIALIISGIVILLLSMASHNSDFLQYDKTLSRFDDIFSSNSVKARLHTWELAWNAFKERPFLGWGQENFIGIYTVNRIPFTGTQVWLDRAHNIIMEWLISAGIPGLISYLAIFGTAFFMIRKKYHDSFISKQESVVIVTSLISYFFQDLFTFDTINSYFIVFALLAYIDRVDDIRGIPDLNGHSDTADKSSNFRLLGVISVLSLLGVSASIYYTQFKPMRESQTIIQIANNISRYKSYSPLLADFNKALSFGTFGNSDIRGRMYLTARSILERKLINQEGAMNFIAATVKELETGRADNGHNLEYLTDVIRLYTKIASYDSSFIPVAEGLVRRCIQLNPDYEWLYFALADIYKSKKEFKRAFEMVNKMVMLDPENDSKQFELVLAAISAQNNKIAGSALEEIKKIRVGGKINTGRDLISVLKRYELYRMAHAYLQVEEYEMAVKYFAQVVSRNPRSALARIDLAEAYFMSGDKDNALKEARKAAEIDPERYHIRAEMFKKLNN
jgi:O-antigen ligase/tetratricopeptide (TPR) repeat protein